MFLRPPGLYVFADEVCGHIVFVGEHVGFASLPGMLITNAGEVLQTQYKFIKSFP